MEEIRIGGTFTKLDNERRLAFGWAYVTEVDGELSVDHSGDFVDKAAEVALEDAAYEFVKAGREADEMHEVLEDVAKLVESIFLTKEKALAMGITGITKFGWWVGFKIVADDVWAKVKDGTYPGFSIRGSGRREAVAA